MSILQKWFKPKDRREFKLFQIEPTLQCNLSCVMCPWTELRQWGGHMEWETFARIQEYLPLAESVDLTGGGEPLTHPRLPEMVRASKKAGCQVGFSSNGMHLNAEMAQTLLEAGLDWISFSVDAASPRLYESIRQGANFEQVTGNIARLSELKARLGLSAPRMMMVIVLMNGDPHNVHELPDYVRLAHRLGVEQVIAKNLDVILREDDDRRRIFKHAGEPDQEVEQAIHLAQQAAAETGVRLRLYSLQPEEQVICEHNPLKSVFFNYEGEVSPCITLSYAEKRYFAGQEVYAPCLRFGNIRQQTFPAILEAPEYRQFRQQFEERRNWEKQMIFDVLLPGAQDEAPQMPPAPEGCRSCYYLYGI